MGGAVKVPLEQDLRRPFGPSFSSQRSQGARSRRVAIGLYDWGEGHAGRARQRARDGLEDSLDFRRAAREVPAPKRVARVLEQLNEGDQQAPLQGVMELKRKGDRKIVR